MTQRDTILQELADCGSSLQPALTAGPYQLPEGYFNDFPDVILSRIRTEETTTANEEIAALSPLLGSLPRVSPFKVPEGYFTPTAEQEPDTTFLAAAGKQMPYSVPEDYFAQLPARIQRQVTARVIPLNAGKWFRYAAAAIITGVIALSGLMIWQQQQPGNNSSVLASKEVRRTLEGTSVEALENFVQVTSPGINNKEITSVTAKSDELNSLFREIPDSELDAFLDVTSDGSEDESLLN